MPSRPDSEVGANDITNGKCPRGAKQRRFRAPTGSSEATNGVAQSGR